jgi:archaellum biogenesis ATPase FlaH
VKIDSGILTDEQKVDIELSSIKLFKSNLDSLDGVGVAPKGELTTIIGPKGNGKSAFVKSILYQAALQNVKTLIILSEEKTHIYKKPVAEIVVATLGEERAKEHLSKLLYTSILDWQEETKALDSFLARLEETVKENAIEFVILDNFTTSFLGRLRIDMQGKAAEKIREFAGYHDLSFMVVCHTVKGINPHQQLITGEDVRGNSTITNTAAYVYVLSTLFKCSPPRAFLHIDKARYYPDFNQTFWELRYDKQLGVYTEDMKVSAKFIESLLSQIRKDSNSEITGVQIWKNQTSIKRKKDHWTEAD